MQKGSPELRVFPLRSPTPGPQLSSCRDLGETLRGQSGPGKPAFLTPPQTAHLLPTKCPGSQFKEASLTTRECLSSAAGGDLSVCINDHWTCWPLGRFIFPSSAFSSVNSPHLRTLMFIPFAAVLPLKVDLRGELLKCADAGTSLMPTGSDWHHPGKAQAVMLSTFFWAASNAQPGFWTSAWLNHWSSWKFFCF